MSNYTKQLQYLLMRITNVRNEIATPDIKLAFTLNDTLNLINDLIEQLIEHETNGT